MSNESDSIKRLYRIADGNYLWIGPPRVRHNGPIRRSVPPLPETLHMENGARGDEQVALVRLGDLAVLVSE